MMYAACGVQVARCIKGCMIMSVSNCPELGLTHNISLFRLGALLCNVYTIDRILIRSYGNSEIQNAECRVRSIWDATIRIQYLGLAERMNITQNLLLGSITIIVADLVTLNRKAGRLQCSTLVSKGCESPRADVGVGLLIPNHCCNHHNSE